MLEPLRHILKEKTIILASGSIRRKEILERAGIKCVQQTSSVDESQVKLDDYDTIDGYVEELALRKVLAVDSRIADKEDEGERPLVIGADTVVVCEGNVFGKPNTKEHAIQMLNIMSNNMHTVYTGVAVKRASTLIKFAEKTDVYFGKITQEQIEAYVNTGEPMDKAGGYGIQGIGGTLVERINGDYYNVVGLPLHKLFSVIYDLYKDEKL